MANSSPQELPFYCKNSKKVATNIEPNLPLASHVLFQHWQKRVGYLFYKGERESEPLTFQSLQKSFIVGDFVENAGYLCRSNYKEENVWCSLTHLHLQAL